METLLKSAGTTTNGKHSEGPVAKMIEDQTSRLPSDAYLWTGIGLMAVSFVLQLSGRQKLSNFIGHWPTNILLMGLYNKIVKTHGHD